MDRLPRDVLYRILDHLLIKWVASFRCANKEFYGDPVIQSRIKKLVEEPKLVCLRSFPVWKDCSEKPCFELDLDDNILEISTPEYAERYPTCIRYMTSCNGLMIFGGFNGMGMLLVNPILEEVLAMSTWEPSEEDETNPQDPYFSQLGHDHWDEHHPMRKDWTAIGFGLDQVNGLYKLVVIMPEREEPGAVVFDFDTRWWRVISRPQIIPDQGIGTFINGILYWLPDSLCRGKMLSFDVAKEEFSELPCHPSACALFDLENKPGIAYFDSERHMHILELNTFSEEWTEKYEIRAQVLELPPGYDPASKEGGFDILGIWNQRIVISINYTFYSYDPQSRKAEYLGARMECLIKGSLVSLSRFNRK